MPGLCIGPAEAAPASLRGPNQRRIIEIARGRRT
jgi:hypothetical protein